MSGLKIGSVRGTFTSSMLGGLAAGVVTAVASYGALVLVGSIATHPSHALLPATIFGELFLALIIAVSALALAVFPIGPLWALVALILYRGPVTSNWPYALAGASVAAYVPIIWHMATMGSGADILISAAWFALAGGVGGYVSGRALQRAHMFPRTVSQ